MKTTLSTIILVAFCIAARAQNVGINTDGSDPDASAILDLKASGKGFLVPRMTWALIPAAPVTGLLIYSTDGDGTNGAGFYYYNGSIWVKMFAGANNDYILNQTTQQASANFNISGAGVIGTTLTVTGNNIFGDIATDANFNLKSTGGIRMMIDNDNDGSEDFAVQNGGGTNIFTVTEAGNVTADGNGIFNGNLTLSGSSTRQIIGPTDASMDIKSETGFDIILNYDDPSASSSFIIKKSNSSTSLFSVSEDNNPIFYPYGTAAGSSGGARFRELAANGSNYVGFKSPDLLGADYMYTLPSSFGTSGYFLQTDGSGGLTWTTASDANAWKITGNTGTSAGTNFLGTTDAQDMLFKAGGSGVTAERLRLKSSGNHGTNYEIVFGAGDGAATTYASVLRGPDRTGPDVAGVNLTLQPGDGTGTGGSGDLVFKTAPVAATSSTANTMTERVRILKDGKVGVGTSVPEHLLHIAGDNSNTTNDGIFIDIDNANNTDGTLAGLRIKTGNGTGTPFKGGIFYKKNGTFDRGDLYFLNDNAADGNDVEIGDARMVILNSGFVGINTTNPSTLFHIDGGTTSTTQTIATITGNSLTTGKGLAISSSTITTGNLLDVRASNTAATSNNCFYFENATTLGNGGKIKMTGTTGETWGLYVDNASNDGLPIVALKSSTTAATNANFADRIAAVYSETKTPNTIGVFGAATDNTATQSIGVWGIATGANSIGVVGIGNGQSFNTLAAGAGGYFTGSPYALYNIGHVGIAPTGGTANELRFFEPAGTEYTAFKSQAQTTNITYTLPAADGSADYVLKTNGTGTLSWTSISSLNGSTLWQRTGTSLSPLNANDVVSISTDGTIAEDKAVITLANTWGNAGSTNNIYGINISQVGTNTAWANNSYGIYANNFGSSNYNYALYGRIAPNAYSEISYGVVGDVRYQTGASNPVGIGLLGIASTTSSVGSPLVLPTTNTYNSAIVGITDGNTNLLGLYTSNALTQKFLIAGDGTITTSMGSGIVHSSAGGVLSSSAVALTTDVSGTLPVGNGGTGTNTSFTQGSVIFAGASGVYSQDNSSLYWDDTNNRLSIGTNTTTSNKFAPLIVQQDAGVTTATFALVTRASTNPTRHVGIGYDNANNVGFIQSRDEGTSNMPLILNYLGGNVGVGIYSTAAKLDVANETANPTLRLTSAGTTNNIHFRRSQGTMAAPTIIGSGGVLGKIWGMGYDGNSWENSASISFEVDASSGDGDMPGRIVFLTSPDGSATIAERMRITNEGNVGIGATPSWPFDVKKSLSATSGFAKGVNVEQTLTATANSDKLHAVHIKPTFTNGAYTNVDNYGLVVEGAYAKAQNTVYIYPLWQAGSVYNMTNTSGQDIPNCETGIDPDLLDPRGELEVKLVIRVTGSSGTNNFKLRCHNGTTETYPILDTDTWTWAATQTGYVVSSAWKTWSGGVSNGWEVHLYGWTSAGGNCNFNSAYIMVRPKQ